MRSADTEDDRCYDTDEQADHVRNEDDSGGNLFGGVPTDEGPGVERQGHERPDEKLDRDHAAASANVDSDSTVSPSSLS